MSSFTYLSLSARLENAAVAYVRYLSKTIWPADLSVFYPLPDHWSFASVAGSLGLLLILSALFIACARRHPDLLVGWFWFLGTLVPAIGLVQVGSQSIADRYMYIPSIGLFIMAVWGLAELHAIVGNTAAASGPKFVPRLPALATAFLVVAALSCCVISTSRQLAYWQNEEALFRHAAQVAPDNYLAYDHLAKVCESDGRREEALAYYDALLRLKPRYAEGQYNIGTLLLGMGLPQRAVEHLRVALELRPRWSEAHSNLGLALFRQNHLEPAVAELKIALDLASQNPEAYVNLGVALLALNRPGDAATAFAGALHLRQDAPEPHLLLALALDRGNQPAEARAEAEKARALALAAGHPELVTKAAQLLAACTAKIPLAKTP